MIGAKSQDSILTSKADYVSTQDFHGTIQPAAWTIADNYSIYCRVAGNPWWASPQPYSQQVTAITFTGTTVNNDELEFAVDTYVYNTNTKLAETRFYPTNTKVSVYSKMMYNDSPTSDRCSFKITLRRKDGGVLTPSDMEKANVIRFYQVNWIVKQTTAIPPSWLETTTRTVQTVTTATKPAAYDVKVGTIPALEAGTGGAPPAWFDDFNPTNKPWFVDVVRSLEDWTQIVTLIAGQMKIFWVFGGFVVIGLLLAWLLH